MSNQIEQGEYMKAKEDGFIQVSLWLPSRIDLGGRKIKLDDDLSVVKAAMEAHGVSYEIRERINSTYGKQTALFACFAEIQAKELLVGAADEMR